MFDTIEKYSWDQSSKSVTLYVPADPSEEAEHSFTELSFCLRVGSRQLKINNLCHPISSARLVRKPDRVQLKLIKEEPIEWSGLDDTIDKKKQLRDKRVKSGDLAGASTQELLADMYANATDEERSSLLSAAAEGARKREEQATRK